MPALALAPLSLRGHGRPCRRRAARSIWSALLDFRAQCDTLADGLRHAKASEVALDDNESLEDALEAADPDDPASWGKVKPRMLTFGPPELFFASLRAALGTPASDGLAAMAREHTVRADSDNPFNAPNYDITTTSKLEWCAELEP
jgi:hypothetical protein